ncbi:hypothetical protein GCM10027414_36950 [Humibacter ginsengiterrae]
MPSARFGAEEALSHALRDNAHVRALVRTTGGIEELAAEELQEAGHHVIGRSRRQLVVALTSTSVITRPPRLVDDLFLIAADVPDPGRLAGDLRRLAASLAHAVRTLPVPIGSAESIGVTGSFVGRRTFTRYALEDAVGAAVQRVTGAEYVSRAGGTVTPPAARVELRIVLDGTRAILGVRPFTAPLHRREWRTRTVPGSLHPPVAAAIARIADIRPGHVVLDPFTGAGTVLLEAARIQNDAHYLGSDRDRDALRMAHLNAAQRPQIQWRPADARQLAQFAPRADRIITNPPWGRRQPIGDIQPYIDQWRLTLRCGGIAVAILNPAQARTFAQSPQWNVLAEFDVTVAGQPARIVSATPINGADLGT